LSSTLGIQEARPFNIFRHNDLVLIARAVRTFSYSSGNDRSVINPVGREVEPSWQTPRSIVGRNAIEEAMFGKLFVKLLISVWPRGPVKLNSSKIVRHNPSQQ
jgi:hypothetical protein